MRHDLNNLNTPTMRWAGIICFVLLVVLGYFTFFSKDEERKPMRQGVPLVQVFDAKKGDMMRHIVLSGQTVADANIVLAPKYAGRVTAVNVELGDFVHEGDILLVQDTGDLDIAILQNEAAASASGADALTEEAGFYANYAKAKSALEIQEARFDRQKYLFSIGAISQDGLDSAEESYLATKAAFEALENQGNGGLPASVLSKQYTAEKNRHATEALRKQRNDMILRAPRDGVIGYRNVEVGSYLTAGSKVLTLVDNSHIYVDCSLSENDAAVLDNGMMVKVFIDAMGKEYTGQVIYVSPSMEEGKTYMARISLDNTDGKIKAGLFARSSIDILQRENAIAIPKDAVQTKNGRTYVFVVKQDNAVEQRDVTIGLLNDTDEEILSGVNDGDRVVLTNQDRLQDGSSVKVAGDE